MTSGSKPTSSDASPFQALCFPQSLKNESIAVSWSEYLIILFIIFCWVPLLVFKLRQKSAKRGGGKVERGRKGDKYVLFILDFFLSFFSLFFDVYKGNKNTCDQN